MMSLTRPCVRGIRTNTNALFCIHPTPMQTQSQMQMQMQNQVMQKRTVSSSPYGRTHVWKRRAPTLPNPLPPKFPQKVIRSDGSSFTHYTTSPRSLVRLTRDTTNNPAWNTGNPSERGMEEESGSTGRMGRFSRRFEGLGEELGDEGWMEKMGEGREEVVPESARRVRVGKKK